MAPGESLVTVAFKQILLDLSHQFYLRLINDVFSFYDHPA